MVEVEVLYVDLSRQRVPLDQVDTLPKDKVLAIIVQTDEEEGKKRNIVWKFGFDHYALCQRETEGQPWVMLHGWDDGDYIWRRLSNTQDADGRREVDAPLGCMNVIFRGQSVTDAEWKVAEKLLYKEII